MKKKSRGILIVLCFLLLGVFIFSGYQLYSIISEYNKAKNMYEGLSGQYTSEPAVTPTPMIPESPTESQEPEEEIEVSPISVDFDALLSQSKDVVGWLYSPDTPINYPLVQGEDNDYYLYRFIDGTYNGSGTLFLDYQCEPDFTGDTTVIYGHHMQNGTMLASICEYGDQEYYEAHPVMYLNTPTQNYKLELFSGFITAADSAAYTFGFTSDEHFRSYIDRMKDFSDFDCDVEVTTDDRVVVLSTCTYEYDDARFVLFGKLIPIA